MGLGGISLWQLLIIFAIVILIFGTSKLKSLGSDLGGAVKGFKKAMDSDDKPSNSARRDAKQLEADKPDADFEPQVEKDKEKHS